MTRVVVTGAGPAGLAAACRAAESGARVTLVDANPRPGGQIWRHADEISAPADLRKWTDRLEPAGVVVLSGRTVIDIQDSAVLAQKESGGVEEIGYDRLVLACGAQELLLPFPGWTLPHVMGAGGAQVLMKTGMSVRGRRVVVAGSGPLLFAVAGNLAKAGAKIITIAEQAPLGKLAAFGLGTMRLHSDKVIEGLGYARHWLPARYRTGTWIERAHGGSRVEAVTISDGRRSRKVECDLVACGFGFAPSSELAALAGCSRESGRTEVDDLQRTSVERIYCAGEITGVGGVDLATAEGEVAGFAAAGNEPEALRRAARRNRERAFARLLNSCFDLRPELRELPDNDTIVCRCEDVTWGRLKNHADLASAKLTTRCAMGPCQGRICANALRFLLGWELNPVRPPAFPVRIGDLVSSPRD